MRFKWYEITCCFLLAVFISFVLGYFIGRDSVDGTILITPANDILLEQKEINFDNQKENSDILNDDISDADSIDSGSSVEMENKSPENEDNNESTGLLVNINMASAAELKAELPGIGDVLSQRIVEYREQHGRFMSKEEIKNVSGIGTKTYEKIKDLITI